MEPGILRGWTENGNRGFDGSALEMIFAGPHVAEQTAVMAESRLRTGIAEAGHEPARSHSDN